MALVRTDSQHYSGIASAIRGKLNTQTTYSPGQMAAAIDSIETPALETLSAAQNGTYTPSSGKNGFSEVTVAVPPPTLVTKTVTQNGRYDPASDSADGYSAVTVNVSTPEKALLKNIKISSGVILSDSGRVAKNWAITTCFYPTNSAGDQLDVNWSHSFKIGAAFKRTSFSANSALFGTSNSSNYSTVPSAEVTISDGASYLGFGIGTSSTTAWDRWTNVKSPLTANQWYYFEIAFDESTLEVSWRLTEDFISYTSGRYTLSQAPFYSSSYKFIWGTLMMSNAHTNADLRLDFGNCFIESQGTRVWGNYTGSFPNE